MPAPTPLSSLLPPLELSAEDESTLHELAATLVESNIEEWLAQPPAQNSARWSELRMSRLTHGNGGGELRVYEELGSAEASLAVSSILLVGTVAGNVDDLLLAYTPPLGAVAAGSASHALKLRSMCIQDGAVDCKTLQTIVAPSVNDPLHHLAVTWRQFSTRDYICVDATGVAISSEGEQIAYSLSHSVDFAQLPTFEHENVGRGNVSVCSLFRQCGPHQVAVYARGFFDLHTEPGDDPLVANVALRAAATRWLGVTRHLEFVHMRKLSWKLRALNETSKGALVLERESSIERSKSSGKNCAVCGKSAGFLASKKKTCAICRQSLCSTCQIKRRLCELANTVPFAVDERKEVFCPPCHGAAALSDARVVAMDELSRNEELERPTSSSMSSFRGSKRSGKPLI
ncbi:hypothetical protein BBJ28_00008165 [Nothophytophthora sp. Chile5]|nr:hypothetical protein BBJ28_00008165 [Nothophytophthora sp. Chile5]